MKNINSAQVNFDESGLPEIARNLAAQFDLTGKTVLEIGCGWGGFIGYLQTKKPAAIFAIEPTQEDLDTALADTRLSGTHLLVASGLDTPFESKKFDYVFMWEVLEHIPPGTEMLLFAEISRIMKDDGILCLSTPLADYRSIITDPAYFLLKHRHYSMEKIEAYAARQNFDVVDVNTRGTLVLAIWHISGYFSKWVLRKKSNILSGTVYMKFMNNEVRRKGWVSLFVTLRKKREL